MCLIECFQHELSNHTCRKVHSETCIHGIMVTGYLFSSLRDCWLVLVAETYRLYGNLGE